MTDMVNLIFLLYWKATVSDWLWTNFVYHMNQYLNQPWVPILKFYCIMEFPIYDTKTD